MVTNVPVTSTSLGSGPNELALNLSEDFYQGDAQFTVAVNGKQVGGTQTVTARHGTATQAFDIYGNFATGVGQTVTINFLNDAYGGTSQTDRNLFLNSATIDGSAIAGSVLTEDSAGPQSFSFLEAAPPPSVTSLGSGPNELALNLSEDFYQGDAQFTVAVDGKQVGGTQTVTARHGTATQAFDIYGNFATGVGQTVTINFLNDAYGGTSQTDRNLFLNSATIDGSAIAGSVLTEYSAGPQSFSFLEAAPPPPASPPSPAAAPSSPAFYVAVNGSDATGDGSLIHPFATLGMAQSAMEHSAVHTTYVEGGIYNMVSNLNLTTADNGMSFLAAAGQMPILNGSQSKLINLITLNGTQNATFQGLTFENTAPGHSNGALSLNNASNNSILGNLFSNNDSGIHLSGSNSNIISGNEIDNSVTAGVEIGEVSNNNTVDSNKFNGIIMQGTGNNSGAVYMTGGNNNMITHNAITNTAGAAIVLSNWLSNDLSNANIGNTIAYNSITNADNSPDASDVGAISISDSNGVDTKTVIDHNYVSVATSPTVGIDAGIYLDNWTSGAKVTNNIVVGGNLSLQVHGGENNTISNNIFDLGTRSAPNVGAGLFQSNPNGPVAAMVNNVVTSNIIYSSADKAPSIWISYGGAASISDNLYWNTNGLAMNGTYGDVLVDSNPKVGDPQFRNSAAADYSFGSGSAASAVGFIAIDQANIGLAPTAIHWY